MSLYSFYRISKPSQDTVPENEIRTKYRSFRNNTFWGVTVAYSLYYVCRMSLSVVKQPLIDEGVLTAGQLGVIGSALLFVYAVGKFLNGFIADYCNIRRFMFTGLAISAVINLLMGITGIVNGYIAVPVSMIFMLFAVLWVALQIDGIEGQDPLVPAHGIIPAGLPARILISRLGV